MRQRLLPAARSILLGWVTLPAIEYLVERPLLNLMAGELGAGWFPTVRLMLDCLALAATGWVIGRGSRVQGRPSPMFAAAAFAASLTLWDFGDLVEIRIPWLFRLAWDAIHDARYWESLGYTAIVQIFLFGSLMAGARASRRREADPGLRDLIG